ncbi:hypothetical protein JCM16303_006910 [Sporobolomyces ruberrimus]
MPLRPRGSNKVLTGRVTKSSRNPRAQHPQQHRLEDGVQLEYTVLIEVVDKVVANWEVDDLLEPVGWTPKDWKVAFLQAFERRGWDSLERIDQDKVLEFLLDSHLSCDIHSPKFPSPLLLSHHIVNIPWKLQPDMSSSLSSWENEMQVWFNVLRSNLEKRQYDSARLLQLVRLQAGRIENSSVRPWSKNDLGTLLSTIERNWDGFATGDIARRAWVAALQVVDIMSRLAEGPLKDARRRLFPTISFLRRLVESSRGLRDGDADSFARFHPQPRLRSSTDGNVCSVWQVEPIAQASMPPRGNLEFKTVIETPDAVTIAIGRICRDYTLEYHYLDEYEASLSPNREVRNVELDQGWTAFRVLEWMISTMANPNSPSAVRGKIVWLLRGLLRRAAQHRLPLVSQLLNFNAFRPESRSNEKGSASTQSSYDVSDIRSIPDVLLTSAFETGDEVRIAIGRLCLAYTLDDKYRFTNEKNEDPGWLAFYALKWMISCVQAEQTTREVRHQISWLLHWLLRHAAQGLLASPFELPVNEVALNDNYVRSHEKANGTAASSASS